MTKPKQTAMWLGLETQTAPVKYSPNEFSVEFLANELSDWQTWTTVLYFEMARQRAKTLINDSGFNGTGKKPYSTRVKCLSNQVVMAVY